MPYEDYILIIDDDERSRGILVKNLNKDNFRVSSAVDGPDGLIQALRKHPDLILLSLLMPDMSGIAMLRDLRKDTWGVDVPVVITTSFEDLASSIAILRKEIPVEGEFARLELAAYGDVIVERLARTKEDARYGLLIKSVPFFSSAAGKVRALLQASRSAQKQSAPTAA